MKLADDDLQKMLGELRASPKYGQFDLPESTLRDLIQQEAPGQGSYRGTVKAVRRKLHNITAPYLGDPDYAQSASLLEAALQKGDEAAERDACLKILSAHASTAERLNILGSFYERIFSIIGKPHALLDLACGLNPFSFPWMGLPPDTRYHAYDIHRPRIQLINHYFALKGMAPLGAHQDVLADPPQEKGDVAVLFKEAHRFEQRRRGCNLALWRTLRVRYLLVSLPLKSLSGRHDLADKQRALVRRIMEGMPWGIEEIAFENELVFCIDKGPVMQV